MERDRDIQRADRVVREIQTELIARQNASRETEC